MVSLTRVPTVIERALPFTVLFAAMASFVLANRQLELVVARASGLSAWQFVLPAGLVAVIFGIFATTVFNPVATGLKEESIAILNRASDGAMGADGGTNQQNKPIWIRQSGRDGNSIIGAKNSYNRGLSLSGVSAFVFDPSGALDHRIDAREAEYSDGEWLLRNGTITRSGAPSRDLPGDPTRDRSRPGPGVAAARRSADDLVLAPAAIH